MMDEDADLGLLKEKIRTDRGFNGHHYKDKCFRRRIAVRMRARGRGTFEERRPGHARQCPAGGIEDVRHYLRHSATSSG